MVWLEDVARRLFLSACLLLGDRGWGDGAGCGGSV